MVKTLRLSWIQLVLRNACMTVKILLITKWYSKITINRYKVHKSPCLTKSSDIRLDEKGLIKMPVCMSVLWEKGRFGMSTFRSRVSVEWKCRTLTSSTNVTFIHIRYIYVQKKLLIENLFIYVDHCAAIFAYGSVQFVRANIVQYLLSVLNYCRIKCFCKNKRIKATWNLLLAGFIPCRCLLYKLMVQLASQALGNHR